MTDPTDDQAHAGDPIKSPELRLLMEAGDALPTLALAQKADNYLLSSIRAAQIPPAADPPSAEEVRHQAIWLMATQAHRALRAAMFVSAIGYPDQAIGFKRLIVELHARSIKVYEDRSGEFARGWLQGRSGGSASRVVGQELYEILSGPPHATVRGITDWTAILQEDGSVQIEVGPDHRPEVANPTLAVSASEIRDIGCLLARVSGKGSDPPGDLDAEIQRGFATYLPVDAPGEATTDDEPQTQEPG